MGAPALGPGGVGPGLWAEGADFLAFSAHDFATGSELWATDGTAAGTRLMADVRRSPEGSWPAHLTQHQGRVFFVADDGLSGRELWVTNGTSAGTLQLIDLAIGSGSSNPADLLVWNELLFFSADVPGLGRELWVTDGTTAGTRLVADINPGSFWGVTTPGLAGLGSYVYFNGEDNRGAELWRTDGTTAGTTLVADLQPLWGSSPSSLTAIGGSLVFQATTDATGPVLWVSGGTAASTMPLRTFPRLRLSDLRALDANTALFWADDYTNCGQLWRTDGTAAGTVLVTTINPTKAVWTTPVWAKPGASRLLFNANDGIAGNELWVTDGTAAGTRLLRDIAPPGDSNPTSLVRSGNRVVFIADDGIFGSELHAVDLTDAGDYAAETFGVGCRGSNGVVPAISARGAVRTTSPPFAVVLTGAAPLAASVLMAGNRSGVALPGGCWLWTTPLVLVPVNTDASGSAAVSILLSPALLGFGASFQYATLDPGGAALGLFSVTSGLEVVVGG